MNFRRKCGGGEGKQQLPFVVEALYEDVQSISVRRNLAGEHMICCRWRRRLLCQRDELSRAIGYDIVEMQQCTMLQHKSMKPLQAVSAAAIIARELPARAILVWGSSEHGKLGAGVLHQVGLGPRTHDISTLSSAGQPEPRRNNECGLWNTSYCCCDKGWRSIFVGMGSWPPARSWRHRQRRASKKNRGLDGQTKTND